MPSRDLVTRALEFRSPGRVPRQLWTLRWAEIYEKEGLESIRRDFPDDIGCADGGIKALPPTQGDQYEAGEYTDAWGATFVNVQRGVIGEVREPLIRDPDWRDADRAHIPYELLAIDPDHINCQCAASGLFMLSGACPRPFERLQFLRGSANLYVDLMDRPRGMMAFIERMHDFYCRWVEAWAKTDVDGIQFMDDWGSQRSLLIPPRIWRELFAPMYRDYIAIAKKYGKKTFMHSDGYTLEIIPDLIDMGLDALNTQIFCIGLDKLRQFRGRLTFWGEIDRQHLLVDAQPGEVMEAVRGVFGTLWTDGGCIAQCEFGAGSRPANVRAAFEAWNEVL